MKPTLISLVGPTAVGKTKLAIQLAGHFQTEIISADSRQCYREMNIGTAKPTFDELNSVKHHFINSHSIHDFFSAGEFGRVALMKLKSLFNSYNVVIMVGGSGLYVDAVTKGLAEIPKIKAEIRNALVDRLETEGLEVLFRYLAQVDEDYAGMVDKNNTQRIIRALEVYEGTGKIYSYWRKSISSVRPFSVVTIGLEQEREVLYQNIDHRMDGMIDSGLFTEAKALYQYRLLNPLQTVGYKEIFDYINDSYDYNECVRLLKRNSRRYAKRQLTWFKKNDHIKWFSMPYTTNELLDYIEMRLSDKV
ncbi:MAG: tRNA (adenosine(37)-N6)-dimethylallyltransferase MiaA [Bacteroidota bacterium]